MSGFAAEDLDRLLRLLRQDPEATAGLRAALGLDHWERITAALADVAEAQAGTDQRLHRLTERVDRLAERMDELTQRLDRLTERVDRLAERMDRLTERMDEVAAGLATLTHRVDRLAEVSQSLVDQVSALTGQVDWLRGDAIERRFRERPHTYLGRIARRMRLLTPLELDELLERATVGGALSDPQADEVRLADGVFHGRRTGSGEEVYVLVEASVGVGVHDVERARERAALLARAGVTAIAVVGGTWVVPDASAAAQASGVWQVSDGRAVAPAS